MSESMVGTTEWERAAQADHGALAADPDNPVLLYRLGTTMASLGQLDLALGLAGQAIARAPEVAEYHASLGAWLVATGHREDGRESYQEALRLDPTHEAARAGLGDLLLDQGEVTAARDILEALPPTSPLAPRARGRLAIHDGRWSEATQFLLRHLKATPIDPTALFYLGVALQAREMLEPAAASYHQAVSLDPSLFEAHANLSTILTSLGRGPEALVHAETAARLSPARPGVYLNRSNARRDLGDSVGAIEDLRRAVEQDPGYAEAWSSLGNLYQDMGELSHALDAHERAVRLAPMLAQAHWNRAFTLLATGQLTLGWDEYEWRLETEAARPEPRDFPWPTWTGESVAGRRMLVWREQGLGDELLFLTCLPDLVAVGAQLTLVVSPRLETLVRRSFPGVSVRADLLGAIHSTESFDCQVPMGSLPRWLRRHRDTFPSDPAWLVAEASQRAKWADRLGSLGAGRRVGLCWRSGLVTPERRRHYAPLREWEPVLRVPGIQWINLQYDECEGELAEIESAWGIRVHRWADEDLRNDLESVAGLVSELDAVVTAPTAVSSIAGSLGKATWQVDSGSDWTAFGERRSPWFPSIQVVSRCPEDGDWVRVMTEVARGVAG